MNLVYTVLSWTIGLCLLLLALKAVTLAGIALLTSAILTLPVTREMLQAKPQLEPLTKHWVLIAAVLCIVGVFADDTQPTDDGAATNTDSATSAEIAKPVSAATMTATPEAPKPSPAPSYRAPIDPGAYWDYSKNSFPKLYKKYGADGLKRLNNFERKAAELVSQNKKCDAVTMVGYSEQSEKGNFVSFIDCKNGERFFVSEKDVADGSTAPQSEKSVSVSAAIEACKKSVRARLKFPSEASFSIFNTATETFKTNGNVRVTLDFKAMNGLGNKLPQRAICLFTPDGKGDLDIFDR